MAKHTAWTALSLVVIRRTEDLELPKYNNADKEDLVTLEKRLGAVHTTVTGRGKRERRVR